MMALLVPISQNGGSSRFGAIHHLPNFPRGPGHGATKQATTLSRGGNTVDRQKHPHGTRYSAVSLENIANLIYWQTLSYSISNPPAFLGVKWYRFTKDFKVQ